MGKILVCDSCDVFRHGLVVRLRQAHDVKGAASAEGLEKLANGEDADLVIVDALNACKVCRSVASKNMPFLLLIDDGTLQHLPEALGRVTPASVLHRNAPLQTAIVAVDTTLGGGRYVDPAISSWHDGILDDAMIASGFTARERDMCRAVLDGHSTSEIARRFGLSEHTVKHHLSSVYAKSQVSGRADLTERFSSAKWFR